MKLTKEEQQMMDELENNPNVTEGDIEDFMEKIIQARRAKMDPNSLEYKMLDPNMHIDWSHSPITGEPFI